ncbi:craniofacial development protein 2-like [Penaeus japonicus]|uniref:craniofacial development protein 2-like n=1 Tax=Penaeus japonicus TaxID=27405 RepID=UPI001C70E0DC|nr:craniofacial development protein 2-like [Penaeus japonicus]
MTGKSREIVDMMERRKLDVLCLQETKWKGSKARDLGAGYKLYYHGENGARNGVGVVVRGMHTNGVLEVRRITDRMMSLKLEIDGVLLNVVSAYAPQMGSDREEKEEFWEKLDEAVELIPKEERLIIGADFNGHVGEGNSGDERVIGKYGYGARNNEGQTIVDFAHRTDMAVINTFYSKRESHKVTYTSGGRHTQIDYILCRRMHLKEGRDLDCEGSSNAEVQRRVQAGWNGWRKVTGLLCDKNMPIGMYVQITALSPRVTSRYTPDLHTDKLSIKCSTKLLGAT